jgi:hypothetical protein
MQKELFITRFERVFEGKLFPLNFGTVRLHNPSEYFVDAKHRIFLGNQELGVAIVVVVRSFAFKLLREPLTMLDGDQSVQSYATNLKRLYDHELHGGIKEDTLLDHVIFHWDKRSFPIHVKLLNEYYQRILDAGMFTDLDPAALPTE